MRACVRASIRPSLRPGAASGPQSCSRPSPPPTQVPLARSVSLHAPQVPTPALGRAFPPAHPAHDTSPATPVTAVSRDVNILSSCTVSPPTRTPQGPHRPLRHTCPPAPQSPGPTPPTPSRPVPRPRHTNSRPLSGPWNPELAERSELVELEFGSI